MEYVATALAFGLSGIISLILGIVVWRNRPHARINQYLGVFLVLWGVRVGMQAIGILDVLTLGSMAWMAHSFTLSHASWATGLFGLVVAVTWAYPATKYATWPKVAALWVVPVAVYYAARDLRPGGGWFSGTGWPVVGYLFLALTYGAVLFLLWTARSRDDGVAHGHAVMATALAVPVMYYGVRDFWWRLLHVVEKAPGQSVGSALTAAGTEDLLQLLVRVAWIGLIVPYIWRFTKNGSRSIRILVLAVMATATVDTLSGYLRQYHGASWLDYEITQLFPYAVWVGSTGVILAFVILRGHLPGLEARARWTLSKTTLAAVFVAVFFVASEAAQQFFGETLGSTYMGIAAAGALVFAIAPLSRLADRLANATVPVTDASEHEDVYRAVLQKYLADGTIQPLEQVQLARLAQKLGLDAVRAAELQAEMAA